MALRSIDYKALSLPEIYSALKGPVTAVWTDNHSLRLHSTTVSSIVESDGASSDPALRKPHPFF